MFLENNTKDSSELKDHLTRILYHNVDCFFIQMRSGSSCWASVELIISNLCKPVKTNAISILLILQMTSAIFRVNVILNFHLFIWKWNCFKMEYLVKVLPFHRSLKGSWWKATLIFKLTFTENTLEYVGGNRCLSCFHSFRHKAIWAVLAAVVISCNQSSTWRQCPKWRAVATLCA